MSKIGFTCGAFDIKHAGHDLMFEECKNFCDFLIVGLHVDPSTERKEKNKPIQTVYERFVQLTSSKYIDQVIPYDSENDLLNILKTIGIKIRFVGSDYIEKDFTGKDLCKKLNIEIFYNTRFHTFSSSSLRKRIAEAENK